MNEYGDIDKVQRCDAESGLSQRFSVVFFFGRYFMASLSFFGLVDVCRHAQGIS